MFQCKTGPDKGDALTAELFDLRPRHQVRAAQVTTAPMPARPPAHATLSPCWIDAAARANPAPTGAGSVGTAGGLGSSRVPTNCGREARGIRAYFAFSFSPFPLPVERSAAP
jgi:hypothetical protein